MRTMVDNELLEHVRWNVHRYTDRAYLTRFEHERDGVRTFSTVLNNPDGPVLWSLVQPDGVTIEVHGRDSDGVMRKLEPSS